MHLDVQRKFPTNGWGYAWLGDPDRGFGRQQPGGWLFNILPFIEQESLWSLGAGLDPHSNGRLAANNQRLQTTVDTYVCPSRRDAGLWTTWMTTPFYCYGVLTAPRSCYAVNAGDVPNDPGFSLGTGPNGPASFSDATSSTWVAEYSYINKIGTGISFAQSEIGAALVADGLSNTFMAGEKSINPDWYVNGQDQGDNESMWMGANADTERWSAAGPLQDTPGVTFIENWGSAHPGVFQMVFCDGSVHAISFEIDLLTHQYLGNRHDGHTLSSAMLSR
jgi:hypothetical protein